jgi:4-hydroxybenzoyl-CoA thioesterase
MSFLTNRMPLEIQWGQCDPAGIVFNSRFFEFFDIATWSLFETALGVARHKLHERFDIIGLPLVEAGANFLAPLKFGDSAEIVSTITEFRRSSFGVQHRIQVGGKLAVDGLEKRVWAGPHPDDPDRMRAVPIPDDVIARFGIKQKS